MRGHSRRTRSARRRNRRPRSRPRRHDRRRRRHPGARRYRHLSHRRRHLERGSRRHPTANREHPRTSGSPHRQRWRQLHARSTAGGNHRSSWRATIDGNLLATFLTIKTFLPGIKQRRRGNIITLGSTAGRQANERAPAPYGAAKAAIALLTQQVAAQAGPHGIRANCLAPETILTENNLTRIPTAQQQAIAEFHPLRRLGTPGDVAAAAAFLASDQAAWITGAILDITGGAVLI